MDKVTNLTAVCTAALSHDEKIKNDAEDSKIQEALPPEENIEVSNEKVPAVPAERLVENSLNFHDVEKIEKAQLSFNSDLVKKDYSELVEKINEEANQPPIKELGIELKGDPITLEDGRTCFEFKAKFVDEFFELIEAYKDQVHVDENFSVILKKNCSKEFEIIEKLYDFSEKYGFSLSCCIDGGCFSISKNCISGTKNTSVVEAQIASAEERRFMYHNINSNEDVFISPSAPLTSKQSREFRIGFGPFKKPFVSEISEFAETFFREMYPTYLHNIEIMEICDVPLSRMTCNLGAVKVLLPNLDDGFQKKRVFDVIYNCCSEVEIPGNAFGLNGDYWSLTLDSVLNCLKRERNKDNLDKLGQGKTRDLGSIANLVEEGGEKLIDLFANAFFEGKTKFYEKKDKETDGLDENLRVYDEDGLLMEEVAPVCKQNFVQQFKRTLGYCINSRIIKEYLVLLILAKTYFFRQKDELNFVLLESTSDVDGAVFYNGLSDCYGENKAIKLHLEVAKFREGEDLDSSLIWNIDNLLTIFHEFGHFIFERMFGEHKHNCGILGLSVDGFDENDLEISVIKSVSGIDWKNETSVEDVNCEYGYVWQDDESQREIFQMLGIFLLKGIPGEDNIYAKNLLVRNKYNDFALRQGVCDALHEKNVELKQYLDMSHDAEACSAELKIHENVDKEIKGKFEVFKNFVEEIKNTLLGTPFELSQLDMLPINNILKIIGDPEPQKVFRLTSGEVEVALSEDSNLSVVNKDIKWGFFYHFVVGAPKLGDDFVNFYTKLYNQDFDIHITPEQLREYAENFRKSVFFHTIERIEAGQLNAKQEAKRIFELITRKRLGLE